jgi:lipopolysaccharide transport system ATP-binding protein
MLNGLINPDEGKITMRGRVGALIELGAGFNPILSGRENIYNNGAVLGFTKQEIDAKVEAIIDFSEIREFIDMPVQNYSSGMKVRLGFAVAAQMEPDILIIDEVLAVGDMGFVLKCFKTIDKILPNTAIIFVTHNMPMVSRICTSAILLEKGESKYNSNNVAKAIDLYYTNFTNNEQIVIFDDGCMQYIDARINKPINKELNLYHVAWNTDIDFTIIIRSISLQTFPYITLSVYDKEQRGVALLNYEHPTTPLVKDSNIELTFSHKNLQLSKGIYTVNLIVYEDDNFTNPHLRINNVLSFQIEFEKQTWPPFLLDTTLTIE